MKTKKAILAIILCLAVLLPLVPTGRTEVRADADIWQVTNEQELSEALYYANENEWAAIVFQNDITITYMHEISNKKIVIYMDGHNLLVGENAGFNVSLGELWFANNNLENKPSLDHTLITPLNNTERGKVLLTADYSGKITLSERVDIKGFYTGVPLGYVGNSSEMVIRASTISENTLSINGDETVIGMFVARENGQYKIAENYTSIMDNTSDAAIFYLAEESNLTLEDGDIMSNTNNFDVSMGGVVNVADSATFTMKDGGIRGNIGFADTVNVSNGTLVDFDKRPQFILQGGEIEVNDSHNCGGVYLHNGRFYMTGGTIDQNVGGTAGGIGCSATGKNYIELTGGSVNKNKSSKYPGIGITKDTYIAVGGTFQCTENVYKSDPDLTANLIFPDDNCYVHLMEQFDENELTVGVTFIGNPETKVFDYTFDYKDASYAVMEQYEAEVTGCFPSDNDKYDTYLTKEQVGMIAVRKDVKAYADDPQSYEWAPYSYATIDFEIDKADNDIAYFPEQRTIFARLDTDFNPIPLLPPEVVVQGKTYDISEAIWDVKIPEVMNLNYMDDERTFTLYHGWLAFNAKQYYCLGGIPVKGLRKIGGTKYLFGNDGAKQFGWHRVGGKEMYFDLNTGGQWTGKRRIGKTTYLLAPDGGKIYSWARLGGKDYYFDKRYGGGMVTGKRQIGNTIYFLNYKGYKDYGWKLLGGKKYYFDKKYGGGMITGLRKIGRGTYYFHTKDTKPGADDKGSALCNGSKRINGKTYYFNKSGLCYKIK